MRIGLIADNFTRICLQLEPGIEPVNLTPLNWRYKITLQRPDVVIVESAWLGVKGSWKKKIASYGDNSVNKHLAELLKYCRHKKIPSVFWNKEDPVNYQRFQHNLSLFDVCLSTEQSMLARYKKEFLNLNVVELMPFFFQPKLHNPQVQEQVAGLEQKIVFCGGLYKTEFPDRAKRLSLAIEALGEERVVIFDRFKTGASSWQGNGALEVHEPFAYEQSKKFYQSGLAHLNVNSVDGLKTMFSRRMLELLACGAHVIDVTAHKGKGLLSPFVTQVNSQEEVRAAIGCERPALNYSYLVEQYSVASFIKKIEHYI